MENISDRTIDQTLTFDLTQAGHVYRPKDRPANRRRQKILRYTGREGSEERFILRQTIPVVGCTGSYSPTEAQTVAVEVFFGEPPETSSQAHTMLSARDYARIVSMRFNFTAYRRVLIAVSVAAFILSDRPIRDEVRQWCDARRRESSPDIRFGIASHRPYTLASEFADKLIADMRGVGSEAFG